MDDFEGVIHLNFEDLANILIFKENIAVISSKDDILYVHTIIFEIKNDDFIDDYDFPSSDSFQRNSSFVYYITNAMKKFDWDEIRHLKY